MSRPILAILLGTLLAAGAPVLAQGVAHELTAAGGDRGPEQSSSADSLLTLLAPDPVRVREIETYYMDRGDPEKRLIEERFGLIQHRYRVDADPRGILGRYRAAGLDGPSLERALEEIVTGRYAAYYFFDGVIRPNVFAPERYLGRRESALHEKIHLVQPSLYRALGLRCYWKDSRDPCVRSLEPVAVYLTEFASLEHDSPGRTDHQVNRSIERHLALEAMRCGYGRPVPRCPDAERVREYIDEPLEVAQGVARHGLEEGIRRYVESLSSGDLAGFGPDQSSARR